MPRMFQIPLDRSASRTYIPVRQQLSASPSSSSRSLFVPPVVSNDCKLAPLSPRAGPYFFPPADATGPLAGRLRHVSKADLSLHWAHSWHVALRIVERRFGRHIPSVDVSPTVSSSLGPALRHPVRSRILLPRLGTTGKWRILLPRPFATTSDLDLGPFHQAPSSDGASFFDWEDFAWTC